MPSRKKKPSSAMLVRKKGPKKEEKLNPFEVRINRKKHEVLGQRSKSDRGLPGVARSKAVRKRKKTLLVEYQQRKKSNQFVDRRFGEYDEELTVEEKMMRRFSMERKRKHERSSVFNLEDDNEEGLTHFGQSIGDMERFDHIELSEDEHAEEDIGETHFGGFLKKKQKVEGEDTSKEGKQRSRKEIMEEVVAKSKAMKYKQQSERQGVEELLDKINSDWRTVKELLPTAVDGGQRSEVDDYDRAVRELVYERRGQPTDRMKTEEEIAKEEKMRLEKLEADRIRRMRGVVSSDDAMVTESADYIHDRPTTKKKVQFTLRYKDGKIVSLPQEEDSECDARELGEVCDSGGDGEDDSDEECDSGGESNSGDLDDSCDSSEAGDPGDSCDSSEAGDPGDGCDSSEAGDPSDGCDSSDDGDPGVEYGSDLESDDEAGAEGSKVTESLFKSHSQAKVNKMKEFASRELPYTFVVPKSLEELEAIVADRSPEECLTAVERIHSCNHPSLHPTNKQNLEAFLPVLVDYCTSLGDGLSQKSLDTLNFMAKPLFKLSQLNSLHTAQVFRSKLQLSRESWLTVQGGRRYPPLSTLILCKLVSVVFPASDFEHPVTTPTLLHMGQLLAKCQVKGLSDLLSGLLLCHITLEYLSQSKRYIPELVNYLTSVVGCFVPGGKGVRLPPLAGKSSLPSLLATDGPLTEEGDVPLLFSLIIEDRQSLLGVERAGGGVLLSALSAISQLVELYSDLPSFSELTAPLLSNLKQVLERSWSPRIEEALTGAVELIAGRGNRGKGVLQLLKQKPKSIKFYEPKFDEIYEVSRKKARSKSAGEKQKLKHKVNKERKGAIREIRRDAAFLAKERLSEKLQLDAERAAKTKRILHDLQMGQHEAKQERRKKRK